MKTKRRFSFGKKMYLFVIVTVLAVAFGTAAISYFVNAGQIDRYYKGLAVDTATNFASFADPEYFKQLRPVVESEEFQRMRDAAEEADDESMVSDFLEEKGLWDGYVEQRDRLIKYKENMKDIKYLYIMAIGPPDADVDMYLMDYTDEPIYETGYYEEREPELYGLDNTEPIPPSISNGDWGYLCSAWEPVRDSEGTVICHVGCDISLDDVRDERLRFLGYILISALIFTMVILFFAVLFANRVVVRPLQAINNGMKSFSPSESLTYEDAGVLTLDLKSNDEVQDLYQSIRSMQQNIIDYLKDISVMEDEKEKRDAELSVAAKLQSDLLPKDAPREDVVSIYATMTPAREMGGDFYDYFMIDEDHLGLVMADVSGKGIPAAMFMIVAKSMIKRRAKAGGTPSEMLRDINNALCEDNPSQLFVTVWLGILNLATGDLIYANAGHEYPALMRQGREYENMEADNMPPLATVKGLEYYDITTVMKENDRLFLYTDGIPEAKSETGERFGMDRMIKILNQSRNDSAEDLLARISASVDEFTSGADLFDDITMLNLIYGG